MTLLTPGAILFDTAFPVAGHRTAGPGRKTRLSTAG